jgi:hypothetical protein
VTGALWVGATAFRAGLVFALLAGFCAGLEAAVFFGAGAAGLRPADCAVFPFPAETDFPEPLRAVDGDFAAFGFLVAAAFFGAALRALVFLALTDVLALDFAGFVDVTFFLATALLAAFFATGVLFFAAVFAGASLRAGDGVRADGFFDDEEPAAFFAAGFFAAFAAAAVLPEPVFFTAALLAAVFFFAGVFFFAVRVAMTYSLIAYAGLRSSGLVVPEISGCSVERPGTSDAIVWLDLG